MLNIQDNKILNSWPPTSYISKNLEKKVQFVLPIAEKSYQPGSPSACQGSMCKAPETVHVSPVVDTFSGGTNSSTYSTEIHGSTYIQVSVTTSVALLLLMLLFFLGLVYFHKSHKHQITNLNTAVRKIDSDKPRLANSA